METTRLTTVDEKPDTPSYPLILLPTSFALEETTKYRPHAAVDDTTGDPIGLDDLDTRIRWLLDLITGAET